MILLRHMTSEREKYDVTLTENSFYLFNEIYVYYEIFVKIVVKQN